MGTEPVGAIVDYLQKFIVGKEEKDIIGPCDYELQINGRSILLNNPDSKAELGTLVIKVLVF